MSALKHYWGYVPGVKGVFPLAANSFMDAKIGLRNAAKVEKLPKGSRVWAA